MTEPESSQWRVPTQYTPRREKSRRTDIKLHNEEADEEDRIGHWANSLPVASYEEDSRDGELGAELIAPLGPPTSNETTNIEESQDNSSLTDALQRRLAEIRVVYSRNRATRLQGENQDELAGDLDQQSFFSDIPLSIPSDFGESYFGSTPSLNEDR